MHHGKRVSLISSPRFHLPFVQDYIAEATGRDVLVIGADGDVDLSVFGDASVACSSHFRPDHDRLQERGLVVDAGHDGPADLALVFLGRHSAVNFSNIAVALQALRPGGWLVVDGQKTDGADSLVRQLRRVMPIAGVLSKSHGKVIWLTRPDIVPPEVTGWRDLTELRPNRDGFISAPGMFSNDALDPGTVFLADNIDTRLSGRAADLGAGWGALTALLLRKAPGITAVDLFEADAHALDAARRNVSDPRATFHWADVSTLRPPGKGYDVIVSNPPFHATRAADPAIGNAFIAAAARLLSPKGRFLMVANRHLPYEETLGQRFRNWSEIAANPRYKVISAAQPRPDQR